MGLITGKHQGVLCRFMQCSCLSGFSWRWLLPGLILVGILLGLSFWQLQRAEEKSQLLARIAQLSAAGAENTAGLEDLGAKRADGLAVKFVGRWIPPLVWLVDNQVVNGRVGYDVLVPVKMPGRTKAILVNLGWVAAPEARKVLPRIDIPSTIQVDGIYRAHPGGLLLGTNIEDQGVWPMRIQLIRAKALAPYVNLPLFPGCIYQQQNNYFEVHYHPVVLPPERHRAYALQWALLALALFIVFVAASRKPRGKND